MKKKYLNKLLIPFLIFLVFACGEKTRTGEKVAVHNHTEIAKYTCPMHPQIVSDSPGKCPLCGMDLVLLSRSKELHPDINMLPLLKPVNEQVISNMNTISPVFGTKIFTEAVQGVVSFDTRNLERISSRVSGRIEKMYIKYNFQPISKGQLIMEIYSPDLVTAQREFIYILKTSNDEVLLEKAKQKLSLLGMQPTQVNRIAITGEPLYKVPVYSTVSGYIAETNKIAQNPPAGFVSSSSPASSTGVMGEMNAAPSSNYNSIQQNMSNTPVITREGQYINAGEPVFTVYKNNKLTAEFYFASSFAAEVKKGQKLLFSTITNPGEIKTGSISMVEPFQKNGEDFTVARVYLYNTNLKPGQLLAAEIPVVKNNAFWLPQDAVLQLGFKSVVFKKENGVFIPKQVQTGLIINGEVEIKDSIGGWEVAEHAGFLVDSESFIRVISKDSK